MDQNEHMLGDLLNSFAQTGKVKEKLFQKKLEASWLNLFGSTVNEYTRMIRLRNGILTLYLDSSALRHEMQLAKENVKAIVNGELREEYVTDILIQP